MKVWAPGCFALPARDLSLSGSGGCGSVKNPGVIDAAAQRRKSRERPPTDSFLSFEFRRMTSEVEAVLGGHKTAAMIRTRICSAVGAGRRSSVAEDRAG